MSRLDALREEAFVADLQVVQRTLTASPAGDVPRA